MEVTKVSSAASVADAFDESEVPAAALSLLLLWPQLLNNTQNDNRNRLEKNRFFSFINRALTLLAGVITGYE